MNLKKLSSEYLREKLKKAEKVAEKTDKFYLFERRARQELTRRARAKIFVAASSVLRLRSINNQFYAAAYYADAVINGCDFFATDEQHEINARDTKNGVPYIVYF